METGATVRKMDQQQCCYESTRLSLFLQRRWVRINLMDRYSYFLYAYVGNSNRFWVCANRACLLATHERRILT